ncbi:MAG: hypothetical protein Unbinned92contig1002_44 [Prokaryotic dsDNA virus sp.]|nr:MAG: hypothetical protein Unbinned92contig1002_44 [Prokaryotic dsDNA virus sp.]|tara:strand:- start:9967 stop:10899 length:933 start_codon:yes stop_codon:yes gene_type:complete
MATTVNITTTYAGEFSQKYISAALLSSSTISDGGVEVMPNVKYREVIQRVETGSLIANGSCDFDASSSVTLTEVTLEPEEFQVNLQLCKKDFINTWDAIQMGYSAFDQLPTSFADYLIAHVAAKVAAQNETNIWQGATLNPGEYDGFEAIAAAPGSGVVTVAAAGGGLTAANILAEMQKVVDAIPNTLYGKEELKLYISPKAAKLYVQVLGGFAATIGANGVDNRGTMWYNNGSLSYNGVPIFVARGLSADKMFAAESTNLFFGTGLMNDWNVVKTIDMADIDGSQNVRVVMRFTAGLAIGVPQDVVFYA